ncbi:MAG: hypothetical protein REI78_01090 [Pedobacter sp.]|nr:hypothetical protein [Pedobacter sp.]MDQ8051583.1 hypothetical protein [Pedobacter sp.]
MKALQHSSPQPIHTPALLKRILIGAVVGLALISVFLSGNIQARPEWGRYWMAKPFLMMAFAGAMGGLCFYFINRFFAQHQWSKTLAIVVSLLVCIAGLFFGFVLGLNGTLWN